jgi:hypothetical protein
MTRYYAFSPVTPLPYRVKLFQAQKRILKPRLPKFMKKPEVPPDALLAIRFDPKQRRFVHTCPPGSADKSQRLYRKLGRWPARFMLFKALWGGWREMENVLCDHAHAYHK